MSYHILPASADLVGAVVAAMTGAGKDYSGTLVVFPGKRPAHFVRKRIAEEEGSAHIPPAIFSMEEFIDHCYETMAERPTRKMETIDAIAFLFDIHRRMAEPLGGEGFLTLDGFFPLGQRIYRDLEELLIEHVDLKRLREIEPFIDVPLPQETARNLQSLSFFYERFYQAIEEAGFSSRSQRYRAVCSAVTQETLPWAQIIFAGFYALTRSEVELFGRLLGWKRTLFLFHDGPGIGRYLERLGLHYRVQEAAAGDAAETRHPRIHVYKSPDAHGQVFALSALLKEQMAQAEGRPAEETVIVLPSSESLFPVFYHALPLVPDGDYNISLGYPLERTPLWGFLSSLMQLVMSMDGERCYIADYLGFVLHPYTKNIYMDGRAEATRILFHGLEESLLDDRTRTFIGLDEIEAKQDLFASIGERISRSGASVSEDDIRGHLATIHRELVRKACAFENMHDFAQKITDIIVYIYEHSSARLHPFFHPYAESFIEELGRLGRSRIKDLAFAERNSYFHFLKRYIGHCFTPFEGTPLKGLQVLGFLETRNLHFSHTYILDANEDVIPDTRKEETLLPLRLRQTLGLPTYRDRDMLSAYYFNAMIEGSEDIHIFYVENDRKEKSRFVERLLWERQKAEGAERTAPYVTSVGYRVSLKNDGPPTIAKTREMAAFLRERPCNATSLDVYLRCPVQFYYRYVLGLARKEDAASGIERIDVGKIVHDVLFRYFDRRKGSRLTASNIDVEEMDGVVGQVFSEIHGAGAIGSAYLLERQIKRQMQAFLTRYQMPVLKKAETTILHLEHRLEAIEAGFRFKGIADRIERRGNTVCIVDYKTGASAARLWIDFNTLDIGVRESWPDAIGSIQLPFYLFLYGASAHQSIAQMQAMFLLLGKAHIDGGIEMPLWRDVDTIEDNYRKARAVILGLASEISNADVPFSPALPSGGACGYCDYRYMCGMQWQGK